MEEIINKILKKHESLFGLNPSVEYINVGFTNKIYSINDKYILKICNDYNNEESFKKEIEFYSNNKNSNYIPKLYYSCINKKEFCYFYEIIEKLDGVSLYSIWHKLTESERENVIKKLCTILKSIHKNIGKKYSWNKYLKEKFLLNYMKVNKLGIFNEIEKEIINNAYSKFDKYLDSDKFVLIHNDLHFDNIFYNNGDIKLIDFERFMYAPLDFELDIIYRMTRNPIKFASEEEEKYFKIFDYKNIIDYLKKYYPLLFQEKNLDKRLAIYDIVYYMESLVQYPHLEELKNNIVNASKQVI